MRGEILRLYKNILRYGQNLKYTDKNYFQSRIRANFRENKALSDKKSIQFQIEVISYSIHSIFTFACKANLKNTNLSNAFLYYSFNFDKIQNKL